MRKRRDHRQSQAHNSSLSEWIARTTMRSAFAANFHAPLPWRLRNCSFVVLLDCLLASSCPMSNAEIKNRPHSAPVFPLRILALETTGASGSVAALLEEQILAERELQDGQRSAQSMAPGIAALLAEVGWQPRDVQLVAVTHGPGSFTGLRVGVTTAKTWAYATGAAILGVDAMLVVAAQSPMDAAKNSGGCWVAFDAQRGEFVVARVERISTIDPLDVRIAESPHIVDAEAWLASRKAGDLLSGPGLARCGTLSETAATVLDPSLWQPRASVVGQIASRAHHAGGRQDLWSLAPIYFRPSAAEEKLAASKPAS